MANKARDEDWHDPDRDERGRFRKGKSGNYGGRPRKPPERPWSLIESIAQALDEDVPVTEGGVSRLLKMRDVVVKHLIRSIPKSKPREIVQILQWFEKMGVFERATEAEEGWTDEDERILEEVKRMFQIDPDDAADDDESEN